MSTALSQKAPWETYDAEMDVKMDATLAAEVAEYAKHRHDESKVSNQNKEVLAEEKERSAEVSKQYQWMTPEEYADSGARVGKVMSHAEFINKLRGLGIKCWYIQHVHPQKAVLHIQRGRTAPEIGCWVQIGQMPELSLMNFDDHGIPLDERRRGWRTCLLQLILKGIVTEQKADTTFGRASTSKAFHRYNATLQSFRNVGGSLGE